MDAGKSNQRIYIHAVGAKQTYDEIIILLQLSPCGGPQLLVCIRFQQFARAATILGGRRLLYSVDVRLLFPTLLEVGCSF